MFHKLFFGHKKEQKFLYTDKYGFDNYDYECIVCKDKKK